MMYIPTTILYLTKETDTNLGTTTTSQPLTTTEGDYGGCYDDEFQCVSSSICIPNDSVCDTIADCDDNSDEENCQSNDYN